MIKRTLALAVFTLGSTFAQAQQWPTKPIRFVVPFAPVILLARVPNILAVAPDVPAKTLQELVALAKAKPDTLTYGSAGNGSSGHLAMEYFMAESAIKMIHVPYKGTGPMLQDMLGGRVSATFTGAQGTNRCR